MIRIERCAHAHMCVGSCVCPSPSLRGRPLAGRCDVVNGSQVMIWLVRSVQGRTQRQQMVVWL